MTLSTSNCVYTRYYTFARLSKDTLNALAEVLHLKKTIIFRILLSDDRYRKETVWCVEMPSVNMMNLSSHDSFGIFSLIFYQLHSTARRNLHRNLIFNLARFSSSPVHDRTSTCAEQGINFIFSCLCRAGNQTFSECEERNLQNSFSLIYQLLCSQNGLQGA